MRSHAPPQKRIFECEVCKTRAPATKRPGRWTMPGHIKHMYCIKCKEVTRHEQME